MSSKRLTLTEAKRLQYREQAKKDLFFFARYILGYNFMTKELHEPLCRFLQQEDVYDKVVMAPRGFLKSTCCAKALPIWLAVNDSELTIGIIKNTRDNAAKDVREIRKHFERNELFRAIFPEVIPEFRKVKWSDLEACVCRQTNPAESTFEAIGINTSVINRHYNVIIEDNLVDIKKDAFTGSELMPSRDDLEKVIGFHKSVDSLMVSHPDKPDRKIVSDTRWAFYDLIGYIEKEQPWFKKWSISAVTADGRATHPERYPLDKLRQIELTQGPYMFSALYYGKPIPPGLMDFKPEWITYFTSLPKINKYMCVDTALEEEDKADFTVIVVGGMDANRQLYVDEYRRFKGNLDKTASVIFTMWQDHKPLALGMQKMAYEKALKQWLSKRSQEGAPWINVEMLNTSAQKKARIRSLVPFAANNALLIRRGMPELEQEMAEFPHSKHDDILDTLAMLLEISQASTVEVEEKNVPWNSWNRVLDELEMKAGYRKDGEVDFGVVPTSAVYRNVGVFS